MDIDHLEGGELLHDGARSETWCVWAGEVLHGHQKAIGEEGDKDVRLDPLLVLMEDRADGKVMLEFFERLLDLGESHVVFP